MDVIMNFGIPMFSIVVSIFVAYFTAHHEFKKQYTSGGIQLLEIVRRYFLNIINALDPRTGKIKTSHLDKTMYVNELETIDSEISNLVANPFFVNIIKKNPMISKLMLQLRREIVEHKETPKRFGLNPGTIQDFYQVYRYLKSELSRKVCLTEVDKSIVRLYEANFKK